MGSLGIGPRPQNRRLGCSKIPSRYMEYSIFFIFFIFFGICGRNAYGPLILTWGLGYELRDWDWDWDWMGAL